MRNQVLEILLTLPGILIGFTFHEYAHAKVADMLGDKTPRFQGRLTLNPFAHIDLFGFIMILILKFGWAKPVQVNKGAFKNGNKDDLKVTIAGPIANLLVAFVIALIYGLVFRFYISNTVGTLPFVLVAIFQMIVQINIGLFIFNLLPLPGLDGFGILEDLFPRTFYKIGDVLYRYQMIIFALIVFAGSQILLVPRDFIYNHIMNIVAKIVYFI